jgi:hypothetical protein
MKQLTYLLAVVLSLALLSDNAVAAKTTVSVTNDTPYALRAVYKAVGCVDFLMGSADSNIAYDGVHDPITINNRTPEVCDYKYVAPGDTVSYEFGGGTSGRKVWAEVYSATDEMLIPSGQEDKDNMFRAAWDSAYVGNSAIVKESFGFTYDLYDDKSNSCAVKGFGILHDAHVTWTKIEVHEDDQYGGRPLFNADCGTVVSQPEAKFVSVGACETTVRNRAVDSDLTFLQQVVGGLADDCAANAKNHGQMVSCITNDLNILVQARVITGAEKGAITACAAHTVPRGKH